MLKREEEKAVQTSKVSFNRVELGKSNAERKPTRLGSYYRECKKRKQHLFDRASEKGVS